MGHDAVAHVWKISEKEQAVLALIFEDPAYTSQKMAELLSVSRKTVSNRLRSLKEKGIIERAGSDTKGYWKINEYKGAAHEKI